MAAFDTHKAVKALCSAGFDDAQAEAVVDQINGAIHENVATKTDIEKLATKEELRDDTVRLATKADLERFATKVDLERFATKEELREEVANLATQEQLTHETEKVKLLIDISTSKNLKYIVGAAGAVVGVTKLFDLLFA